MSTQIAIRLEANELAAIDAEVSAGRARNRTEAIRRSITYLDRFRAYRDELKLLEAIKSGGEKLYPDLEDFNPPVIWG
ncbi:MAG: ribbon-helix-helix domain-containing protein [Cellulomonadaceae bacterium]|nr:ribbon-helix-helix domain-containing protein [Cellulomonadaceae bacterium]